MELLATRQNSSGHGVGRGRSKDKDQVWGRLFDNLEQGIEGLSRQTVNLIDNNDFVAIAAGPYLRLSVNSRTCSTFE